MWHYHYMATFQEPITIYGSSNARKPSYMGMWREFPPFAVFSSLSQEHMINFPILVINRNNFLCIWWHVPISSAYIKIRYKPEKLERERERDFNLMPGKDTLVFPMCDIHVDNFWWYGNLMNNEQIPDLLGQSEANGTVIMVNFCTVTPLDK